MDWPSIFGTPRPFLFPVLEITSDNFGGCRSADFTVDCQKW